MFQPQNDINGANAYLLAIYPLLQQKGIDGDDWLAGEGLTHAALLAGDSQIALGSYQKLIANALLLSDDHQLGLSVAEGMQLHNHGILGFALLSAPTLQQALDVLERFIAIRSPFFTLQIRIDENNAELRLNDHSGLGAERKLIIDVGLLSIYRALVDLTQDAHIVQSVCLDFSDSDYLDSYRQYFHCGVDFSQSWLGIRIDRQRLLNPLPNADPLSFRMASEYCQQALGQQASNAPDISAQVRALLFTALINNVQPLPNLAAIANDLHMNQRTLHRRLTQRQSSYQSLLDEVRYMRAKQLLGQNTSVKAVAYSLDYQDVANFRRAFKRWHGSSPQDYRVSLTLNRTSN